MFSVCDGTNLGLFVRGGRSFKLIIPCTLITTSSGFAGPLPSYISRQVDGRSYLITLIFWSRWSFYGAYTVNGMQLTYLEAYLHEPGQLISGVCTNGSFGC